MKLININAIPGAIGPGEISDIRVDGCWFVVEYKNPKQVITIYYASNGRPVFRVERELPIVVRKTLWEKFKEAIRARANF